jgi:hypothetical protein
MITNLCPKSVLDQNQCISNAGVVWFVSNVGIFNLLNFKPIIH